MARMRMRTRGSEPWAGLRHSLSFRTSPLFPLPFLPFSTSFSLPFLWVVGRIDIRHLINFPEQPPRSHLSPADSRLTALCQFCGPLVLDTPPPFLFFLSPSFSSRIDIPIRVMPRNIHSLSPRGSHDRRVPSHFTRILKLLPFSLSLIHGRAYSLTPHPSSFMNSYKVSVHSYSVVVSLG